MESNKPYIFGFQPVIRKEKIKKGAFGPVSFESFSSHYGKPLYKSLKKLFKWYNMSHKHRNASFFFNQAFYKIIKFL